jgi:hypothetical protein
MMKRLILALTGLLLCGGAAVADTPDAIAGATTFFFDGSKHWFNDNRFTSGKEEWGSVRGWRIRFTDAGDPCIVEINDLVDKSRPDLVGPLGWREIVVVNYRKMPAASAFVIKPAADYRDPAWRAEAALPDNVICGTSNCWRNIFITDRSGEEAIKRRLRALDHIRTFCRG